LLGWISFAICKLIVVGQPTMTSVIYFKLKNAIQQQHVNFDGSVIQIGDVKRLIATKQGLGPDGSLELTLSDPNTGDEYADDGKVIPRNTLVLVKRTPAAKFKPLIAGETGTAPLHPTAASVDPFGEAEPATGTAGAGIGGSNEFGGDFYSEQPTAAVVNDDESKAMQSFLQGTASTWQREVRQGVMRGRGRGRGRGGAGGGVAPEYKCPRYDEVYLIITASAAA
jgi:E3 ubiquitin-protein ligase RBBP6